MKDWKTFLHDSWDGKRTLNEITRDYYHYIAADNNIQPDYGFLLSFYNYIKSGGNIDNIILPYSGNILLENGFNLLQEDGSIIYL